MKVKVPINAKVEYEVIEVEQPYYYQQDIGLEEHGQNVIYGYVDVDRHVSIQVTRGLKFECDIKFEIEVTDIQGDVIPEYYSSCFNPNYRSSREKFLRIKEEALKALNSI